MELARQIKLMNAIDENSIESEKDDLVSRLGAPDSKFNKVHAIRLRGKQETAGGFWRGVGSSVGGFLFEFGRSFLTGVIDGFGFVTDTVYPPLFRLFQRIPK